MTSQPAQSDAQSGASSATGISSTVLKEQLAAAFNGPNAAGAASEQNMAQTAPDAARHDVLGNIRSLITSATGLPLEQLTPSARIGADLGADSLALIEVMVRIEERFNVRLDETDVTADSTVADLVELVDRKVAAS